MVIRGQRFLQGRRQIAVQTPDTVVMTRTSPSPTSHENVWFTFAPMFVGSEEPLAIEGVSLPLTSPGPNECAYCRKEGHYKDTCPELLALNAKWQGGGW